VASAKFPNPQGTDPPPALDHLASSHHARATLDIAQLINSTQNLLVALEQIAQNISRTLQSDGVCINITEHHPQVSLGRGTLAETMKTVESELAHLVREQELVIVKGGSHQALPDFPDALQTIIATPIRLNNRFSGLVWVAFSEQVQLSEPDTLFLMTVAAQIANALSKTSHADPPTGDQAWLSAVIDSAPDPVIVIDHAGVIRMANSAATGAFRTLAPNTPLRDVLQPAHFAPLQAMIDALSSGEQPNAFEFDLDNERTFRVSVVPVLVADAKTGWVLTFQDITHFRRLNENMAQFLSTVSHDMRSPLTFMKGYLDMLGMVGPLNEQQSQFVEKILGGVLQMSDLVEKVLDAGRLDPLTGTYQPEWEPCDIVELASGVVEGVSEHAVKKGLTLEFGTSGTIPIVYGDAAMLSRAFSNLVDNAVKYTPAGGHVEIVLRGDTDRVILQVADNGFGISPDDQKRLFQRNVRLHRKEWKRIKGSGLGLFIVKNVARLHGGETWVESEENIGSTFYFAIPVRGREQIGHSG